MFKFFLNYRYIDSCSFDLNKSKNNIL